VADNERTRTALAGERLPPSGTRRYDPPRPIRYAIGDLERETGISGRTIRFYIAEGLLPPAYGLGPAATYDPGHLLRLRYIKLLKDERLSLNDIRARLEQLTDEDISTALDITAQPDEETWRRVRLHDQIELHIRQPREADRDFALDRAADLIIDYARSVLEDLDRLP
jgi:DNA-binding transcriptional MerR regulator